MANTEENRRRAAVMFTDIQGYSRMMGKDEGGTLEFLTEHDKLFRAQIAAFGGRVVKTIGDAFMAEFESPLQAVRCAVAAQKELNARNSRLIASLRRQVRIGIHTGELTEREGDLFGETVNIAARLESRAPGGGICVSAEARGALSAMAGLELLPLGPLKLKNIKRRVDAFQVWEKGMAPRARRRASRSSGQNAAIGMLAALLLAAFFVAAWPRLARVIEMRNWEPWYQGEMSDPQRVNSQWAVEYDTFYGGSLRLGRQGILLLKKELAIQPFKIRIRYITENASRPEITLFAADYRRIEEGKDNYSPGAKTRLLRWSGYYFSESVDKAGGIRRQSLGLGDPRQGADTETVREKRGEPSNEIQTRELTFEQGRLSLEGGGQGSLETWPGEAEPAAMLAIGLEGLDVRLVGIEVWTRKKRGDVNLLSAAEELRMKGDGALALRLYEQIAERQADLEQRDRYLMKRAQLLRKLGRRVEADKALEALASQTPLSLAGGQALFEKSLNLLRGGHERGARAAFQDLLDKSPGHPLAPKARLLLLKSLASPGGDASLARKLGWEMVNAPSGHFKSEASALLLKAISLGESPAGLARLLDRYLSGTYIDPALRADMTVLRLETALRLNDLNGAREIAWDAAGGRHGDVRFLRRLSECTIKVFHSADPPPYNAAEFCRRLLEKHNLGLSFLRSCARLTGWENSRFGGIFREERRRPLELHDGTRALAPGSRREWFVWETKRPPTGYGTVAAGLSIERGADGSAEFSFDTGKDWGCGFNFWPGFPPYAMEKPERVVDVGRAKAIEFDARIPRGKDFKLVVSEFGVGDINAIYKPGPGGADGEQYIYDGLKGVGTWKRYRVPLSDMGMSVFWGNQLGNGTLDLGGIQVLDIAFYGGQGTYKAAIKNIAFVTP